MKNTAGRNVVHDVLITGFGFMDYWYSYDILGIDIREYGGDVIPRYYRNLAAIELPDGKTWGDFLPAGSPRDNWGEWEVQTLLFFHDREEYLDAVEYEPESDWTHANDHAAEVLPAYHKRVADTMNLCPVYDMAWPHVMFNYRSMTGVVAPGTVAMQAQIEDDLVPDENKTLPSMATILHKNTLYPTGRSA